jgi:SAM-dependent methyltransferase
LAFLSDLRWHHFIGAPFTFLAGLGMDVREFDRFADEYRALHASNISASGESPEYFSDYKMRDFRDLVNKLAPRRSGGSYLDFGAGTGNSVPFFLKYLPDSRLTCLDVSRRSLAIAAERFPAAAIFQDFDGTTLPFEDASFDGAYANCVFHHIDGRAHVDLLKELRRVISPGGVLMIYEHNPVNPLTRRAVDQCPFDENAVLIRATRLCNRLRAAGFSMPRPSYRVFFPRALGFLRPAERYLKWLPLGAQYFVAAVR